MISNCEKYEVCIDGTDGAASTTKECNGSEDTEKMNGTRVKLLLSMTPKEIQAVDDFTEERGFANRQESIRNIVRTYLRM